MATLEQDAFFEFNPAAPAFNPAQFNERYRSSPQLLPHPEITADGHSLHPNSGHDRDREDLRASSCSPARCSSARHSRRKGAGRRSCATAPASPAILPESKGKLAPNRRASGDEVSTLVIKNLALDFRKEDVDKFLQNHGAAASEVELHLDPASASFRGTVFVKYASSAKAREALQKLGPSPEIGGRKARVEVQKSKNLFGRKSAGGDLPQELAIVQKEIDKFLKDSEKEVCLSAAFDAHQRKYAHSLAERHNLVHSTRQNESGHTYVYLSKSRSNQGSRKKAFSVDLRSTPQLSAIGGTRGDMGVYEAQSCYVGPMSPPGLFPGFGTPLLGPELGASDDAMFMLPAAMPGIEQGISGFMSSMWTSSNCGSGEMTEPPPGLEFQGLAELAEGLCNELVADQEDLFLDLKHIDAPAESARSTEDTLSKRSNETDS